MINPSINTQLCPANTYEAQQTLASIRGKGHFAYISESVSSPWGRAIKDHAVDTQDCLIAISLHKMSDIYELDRTNMTVTIGAGISFEQLRLGLAKTGLEWPVQELPGQSSVAEAILGGMAKVNSALFPDIRPWVLGSTIVTGGTNIVHSGGSTIKNSSGYALTRALIGSHGVFGVPTELKLRLRPQTEVSSHTLNGNKAMYESLESALSDPNVVSRLEIWTDQASILTTVLLDDFYRTQYTSTHSSASEHPQFTNKYYDEGSVVKHKGIDKADRLIIPRNSEFMIKWQASPHRCCQIAETIAGIGSARGMLILPLQRMGFAVSDDTNFMQFVQETGLEFNKLPFSESAVRALHENPIVQALNPEGLLK